MVISKKCLPRRTFLRGLGVAAGLPLLDAMVPALAAATTSAKPVRRLGIVYVPNGMAMEYWTPAAEGPTFEFTPILQPLSPFRDRLLVLSGLSGPRAGIDHAGGSTMFLTGTVPPRTDDGSGIHLATSIDQIAAKEFGQDTQLASLELKLDGADV